MGAEVTSLSQVTGLSLTTCQLLFNRGFRSAEEISQFLYGTLKDLPDPLTLPDIGKAVERIRQALSKKEKIFLFGDYDVDGVTGTAILKLFLESQGADVHPLLPNRFEEGYGLHDRVIDEVEAKKGTLLITIDNGTKAYGPIQKAREKGIDVIVLDHHETPEEEVGAIALVNPKKERDESKQLPLCSAGLAFYLIAALRGSLRKSQSFNTTEPALTPYLDLVALGTIADLVPLVGVNRLLVREGLKWLAQSGRIGIKALKGVSSIKEGAVSAGQVGFRLAPRLNAAGRLEHASIALELLTTGDPSRAQELAVQLEEMNRRRQTTEEEIVNQAVEILLPSEPLDWCAIALAREEWHEGVLGIVAARLAERYFRPTIVLTINKEKVKGSGRSIRGFDLHACLAESASFLDKWGGHKAAVGLSLKKENLEAFLKSFRETSRTHLAPLGRTPSLPIDLNLPFSD
ncbi:MAG: single-stranded-DNA-specific exonuclease RecJ, partial [Deltaproteobacteria bacterium]|nr:single-stranded-DNA-specific exonuclease RecJ [Deltaproteobacteria bacterium]